MNILFSTRRETAPKQTMKNQPSEEVYYQKRSLYQPQEQLKTQNLPQIPLQFQQTITRAGKLKSILNPPVKQYSFRVRSSI